MFFMAAGMFILILLIGGYLLYKKENALTALLYMALFIGFAIVALLLFCFFFK